MFIKVCSPIKLIQISVLYLFIEQFVFSELIPITDKICAHDHAAECEQLARDGKLACLQNFHRIDCVLNINNSLSHVGLLRAEEAFLAAPLVSEKVVVIGEVKKTHEPFQTVVVLKTNASRLNFDQLKGLKYCHPGFKHDNQITNFILEELENSVVNEANKCNSKLPLVERHLKEISKFFGPSCRPGLWTQDIELDKQLKSRYTSLCELCGPEKCNVDYKMPMNDSLKCLLTNDADIAVTTLENIETLRKSYSGKYKLLCDDGSVNDLNVPCVWTKQLHDIIIANSEKASNLQNILKTYFTDAVYAKKEKDYLKHILEVSKSSSINFIDIQPLYTYVSERRSIPTLAEKKICNSTMRWCTQNPIEHEKCRWLSQASLNQGIQPIVECVLTYGYGDQDERSCISDIQSGNADIFTLSTNYAYTAAKHDLISIAYPETDTRFVYGVVVVLRKDSNIKRTADLKLKRACIPEFAGKEMFSFVSFIQKKLGIRNPDFGVAAANFLGESCIPGTKGYDGTKLDENSQEKLCSQCVPLYNNLTAKYCNPDHFNKYFGNYGALQCLKDNQGDFAVVTVIETDDSKIDGLKVLCKNDTVTEVSSLKVDEGCAISVIVTSEIVSRANNEQNIDYILALREFEEVFGVSLSKPFHLFERFNDKKDLLFKDSTPGIRFTSTDAYIENLKELIASINRSGSSKIISTVSVIIIPLVYLVIFK